MLRPETEPEREPPTEDVDDPTSPPAVSSRQHTLAAPITVKGLGLLLLNHFDEHLNTKLSISLSIHTKLYIFCVFLCIHYIY